MVKYTELTKEKAKQLKEYRTNVYKKWYSQKKNRDKTLSGVKQRTQKSRAWLVNYKKDKKCEICNESHIATLDFHHKNPNEKLGLVGDFTRCYSLKKLQDEISKCIILCANCHIIKHKISERDKKYNYSYFTLTVGKQRKKKYIKRINMAKNMLGNKCMKCGKINSLCLEFHHRNKSEKYDNVVGIIKGNYCWKKIEDEVKKCDLLCRNCHRILHWEQRNAVVGQLVASPS